MNKDTQKALDYIMEGQDGIQRLLRTVEVLRSPQGCPWDREQSHASLIRFAIEEAHELGEAIRSEEMAHIREELGDVLLQVVLHSQIARENGEFDFFDVADGIANKLIRRHSHVFGQTVAKTAREVEKSWEKNKQSETKHILSGVPASLPALSRAFRLSERAARVGFDFKAPLDVLDKIIEESKELVESLEEQKDPARELGDMLFSLANLARHLGCDPEEALQACNRRFQLRFAVMEDLSLENGTDFSSLSDMEMDALWQKAKEKTGG